MIRIPALPTALALVLILVCLLAPLSTPAQAAVDTAGAARLTTLFTGLLSDQKDSARRRQTDLKLVGDVVVEPAGNYYAVTLPHLSLIRTDGSFIDLGILVINAMPGATAQEWKMSVAIPTPIIGYGADKKPVTRLDIGKQSFTGIWNETINNFTKLDARYENITSLESTEGVTLKIPKASIIYDLTPSADGKTWSGPTRFTLENISMTQDKNPGQSKIGLLTMDTQVQNYSYEKMQDYQSKLAALTQTIDATALSSNQITDIVLDMIGNVWDGFGTTIIAKDISLSYPPANGNPAGRMDLQNAKIALNAAGLKTDNVTLSLKTQYDGLSLMPAPAGLKETTPERLNLDITVDKLPYKKLIDLTRKTVKAASTTAAPQENAGKLAAKLIPQMLTEAGTFIRIDKSFLGNSTYNLDLDGRMNANMAAILGMDGKAKLDLRGLDQLIAATRAKLKNADLSAEIKKKLQGALLSMTILQLSGQQGTDANGKPMRSYNLELGKDGKVMVNGTDLSALQALAGAASRQPKAAKP